jgi:hypothetical protein
MTKPYIKIISSETAWANIVKYYRKHLWKTLYKISSFPYDWTTSMTGKQNYLLSSILQFALKIFF